MRIDAHQHFWNYNPAVHAWIHEHMTAIRRSFLPSDLEPLLVSNNIEATVAVQADESIAETNFLLQLAQHHSFIAGVVGWTDLKQTNIESELEQWKEATKLVGFRSIMQGQPDDQYLSNPVFTANVNKLAEFGYTFDLLVYHDQLPALTRFVEHLPDNRLILDHLGKPAIAKKEFNQWKDDVKTLAKHPNLYCKISGLITEAHHQNWSTNDLLPYMETAAEWFGIDRICFGSDWPVCLLAGTYRSVTESVEQFATQLTKVEQEKLFGLNTKDFYNLSIG